MTQATEISTTNPSDVYLTRKGERAAQQLCARNAAIAEKRAIRSTAAAEVERLLDLLDRLDGDPDLEPDGDDEPTLALTGVAMLNPFDPVNGMDGEIEPTLGWTSTINQTARHRLGAADDAEHDDAVHEGCASEAEGDDQEIFGEDDGLSGGEYADAPDPDWRERLRVRRREWRNDAMHPDCLHVAEGVVLVHGRAWY